MERLQKELGMAIVIITHDLGVVAELAMTSRSCTRGGSSRRARLSCSSPSPSTLHLGLFEVDPDARRLAR